MFFVVFQQQFNVGHKMLFVVVIFKTLQDVEM